MTAAPLYLLDTNTVSYLMNGRSLAARRSYIKAESRTAVIAVSTITQAEILFGLERRPDATRLRENFQRFLSVVQVLPWDSTAAHTFGKLRVALSAAGKSLGLMDLLIAAHAISRNAVLVSHDTPLQTASPLLHVIDWATDI